MFPHEYAEMTNQTMPYHQPAPPIRRTLMDRYDRAIERLSTLSVDEYAKKRWSAYMRPHDSPEGCLFMWLSPDLRSNSYASCPIGEKIRMGTPWLSGGSRSVPEEVLNMIRTDPLIPTNEFSVMREELHAFASVQRKADELLNRDWSEWDKRYPLTDE